MATANIEISEIVKGYTARRQLAQLLRLLRERKEQYSGLKYDEIELILTMIDDATDDDVEE